MKKYLFLIAAAAAMVLASCQPSGLEVEVSDASSDLVTITITASLDEATKATVDDGAKKWVWSEGDQLAVFDGVAKRTFDIKTGVGTSIATFTGDVDGGAVALNAVFPYSAAGATYEDYTIPAVQTVTAAAVADPAAMVATATGEKDGGDYNFTFTSAVSFMRFTSDAAGRFIFHAVDKGDKMTGDGRVVAVDAPSAGTWWVAVKPATYTGLRVFRRIASHDYLVKSDASLDLSTPGAARELGTINSTSTEVVAIETADELIAYLAGSAELDAYVCADLDLNGKTVTSRASLANVFDGQYHTFSKWTSNGVALVTANTGTVRNFTLASDCVLNLPATLPAGDYAFVVATNNGAVSGISNYADVTTWSGTNTGAINLGIIVGNGPANSVLTDCYNAGSLDMTIDSGESGVGTRVIGALCGRQTGSTSSATDCINEGNITIETSMTVSGSNLYAAGVIGQSSEGFVTTRCANSGNVTINVGTSASAILCAGVITYTSGNITDCSNEGNITITSDEKIGGTAIGGVAAYSSKGIIGTAKDKVYNSGNVSVTALYHGGRNSIGQIDGTKSKSSGVVGMGGIVGYTYDGFSMTNAKNEGNVSLSFTKHDLRLDPASGGRLTVGGLVGDGWGAITNSDNFGDVSVSITASSGGTFTATKDGITTYMGGIVGCNYMSLTQTELTITNCVNEGCVSLYSENTHTTNNAIGGIVGWPGTESKCTSITSNCVNGKSGDPSKGIVSAGGNLTYRMGGIQGGSGRIENCTNYGKVWTKTGADSKACTGGIAGFHSGGYQVIDSKNYGPVQADVIAVGLGGIIGLIGNAAHTTGTGCAVNCTLTSAATTEIGLIIGRFNGTAQAITLGSDVDPIEVAGSVNGTVIAAGNYSDYLAGPGNYTPATHVMHATYSE